MISSTVRTVAQSRPDRADSPSLHHIWRTVSLTVDDRGAALAHVALLFLNNGVDVSTVTIQPAQSPRLCRMTMRIRVDPRSLDRVIRRLGKMINVIHVDVLTDGETT
jgi:acetolactate synthase small subunit